jgi:hypothetical protein
MALGINDQAPETAVHTKLENLEEKIDEFIKAVASAIASLHDKIDARLPDVTKETDTDQE